MNIDGPKGRLYDSLKTLGHQWDDVSEVWRDATHADFRDHVMEPLEQGGRELMAAMDRLRQVFVQMRNEVEGQQGGFS